MGSFKLEFRGRIRMRKRMALSAVISSVILAGVVLSIGGGIWSYSLGAASSVATDYTYTTRDMVHTIIERFNIEYVEYNSTSQNVTLWVYNYGSIQIKINTTITINNVEYYDYNNYVNSKNIEEVDINIGIALATNEEVSIKVESERENTDYEVYYVP
jgi:hypothetical protein